MARAKPYDVIVIGGGITGAGVLRDCALRGLKALLLDKGEPGRATTAASTHLIHGGLRYLLYDRLTTHTTAWDAGNIVRIAGDLLSRLPILWPLYRGQRHGPETVETLLEAYDGFQRMKGGLSHLRLGPEETARLVPGLKRDGLLGAVSFDEWYVDAVALVERNLDSARAAGAELLVRTTATGLLREDGNRVVGVSAKAADGSPLELRGRIVINASGPWVDRVGRMAGIEIPLRLRKGTHLVYDRPLTPTGLLLEASDGERHVFVIPFPGGTLVGPTDLEASTGPDALSAGPEELRYLLDSVRRFLPDFPEAYARVVTGARPIIGQSGSEKLLSREYEIFDHGPLSGVEGFLTVAGGKMSDFRLMAKDAVDLACRKLGHLEACTTDRRTLAGAAIPVIPDFRRPWRPLKRFLRGHPRLRELYALSWLAFGLLAHFARRLVGGVPEATVESFREHYGFTPRA